MRIESQLVQAGNRRDKSTGAVVTPVYNSTAFAHESPGQSTGYDYSRMANPTRKVVEDTIAALEGGVDGMAFASGMAAIHCVCQLFSPGDHLVVSDDLYGGTYRLFEQVLSPFGIRTTRVDTCDVSAVAAAIEPNTRALFIETPTNPTMKIADLRELSLLAKRHGLLTIVDNTFMTPYFQRPLALGADIVVHSATKYLGGHNDVLAGLVAVRDEKLAERLHFYQNAIGGVLGPQDSWLLLRGMKTLAVRMDRHNQNASEIAEYLSRHSLVTQVYYPGLKGHPGRKVHEGQASGYGGMVSFTVRHPAMIKPILESIQVITFAESLGGVESLMTYPVTQTHAEIPKEVRDLAGVTDTLLRLSVGIEHVDDLVMDLEQALRVAAESLVR